MTTTGGPKKKLPSQFRPPPSLAAGLWVSFQQAQKLYAIVGALFIPMLALVLLILCGQSRLVGRRYRNSLLVSVLLVAALAFFVLVGCLEIRNNFFASTPSDYQMLTADS